MDTQEDVSKVEDTTVASSSEEQTDVTTTETEDEVQTDKSTDTKVEDEERIPRSRFNEAIEKERAKAKAEIEKYRKEAEEYKTKVNKKPEDIEKEEQLNVVKQQLKDLGFVSKDELEAEKLRAKEDDFVQKELSRLESEWDGKEGKPKFDRQSVIEYALDNHIGDPEAAFLKMNSKSIIDWHIKSASTKSAGVKTETSDGSGSSQVGTQNEDLKRAAVSGDKSAWTQLLKRQIRH